jgi:hypothetical protein
MTSIGAPSKSPSSIDFIFIVKSRNGVSSIICPTVSKLINVYGKLQLCEADTTCNASNLIVVIEKCYRCRCTCTCSLGNDLKNVVNRKLLIFSIFKRWIAAKSSFFLLLLGRYNFLCSFLSPKSAFYSKSIFDE